MKRYEFCITIVATAANPEQAWQEACQAFASDPGCAPEEYEEEEEGDETPFIEKSKCVLCGGAFVIGEDGNELGFCIKCQESPDFPFNIDAYYQDYDKGKIAFKGFDTMSRGILERYKK